MLHSVKNPIDAVSSTVRSRSGLGVGAEPAVAGEAPAFYQVYPLVIGEV